MSEFDASDPLSLSLVAGIVPGVLIVIALAAALLHSFLGLNETHLRVVLDSGTQAQRSAAASLLQLLQRHHWVALSLVLVHAIADEALPIILGRVMNDYIAVAFAVPLVLIFGELLPTMLCSGPRSMTLLARLNPVVWLTLAITSPVTLPISLVMDWYHGHTKAPAYHRGNLKTFLRLHTAEGVPSSSSPSHTTNTSHMQRDTDDEEAGILDAFDESAAPSPGGDHHHHHHTQGEDSELHAPLLPSAAAGEFRHGAGKAHHGRHHGVHAHGHPANAKVAAAITSHEMDILEGTLNLTAHHVHDKMIPLSRAFMLSASTPLNNEVLLRVADTAHSRIPVYAGEDRNHIIGLILVKGLLRFAHVNRVADASTVVVETPASDGSPTAVRTIGDVPLLQPCVLHPDMSMLDALRLFRMKRSHMALVTRRTSDVRKRLEAGLPMQHGEVLGLITLEDCLLSLLNSEHQLSDAHDMTIMRETSSASLHARSAQADEVSSSRVDLPAQSEGAQIPPPPP